mmetsp:Transcript_29953/g.44510  ORF Transcript_29953/g.44510 Transcript_29953/m.44510 type:complete len:255 (-) Transcript_29953:560-1324(-)
MSENFVVHSMKPMWEGLHFDSETTAYCILRLAVKYKVFKVIRKAAKKIVRHTAGRVTLPPYMSMGHAILAGCAPCAKAIVSAYLESGIPEAVRYVNSTKLFLGYALDDTAANGKPNWKHLNDTLQEVWQSNPQWTGLRWTTGLDSSDLKDFSLAMASLPRLSRLELTLKEGLPRAELLEPIAGVLRSLDVSCRLQMMQSPETMAKLVALETLSLSFDLVSTSHHGFGDRSCALAACLAPTTGIEVGDVDFRESP